MNLCLCSINSKYIHSSLAPWCLRAGVLAYGDSEIHPQVVEGTVNEEPMGIVERIVETAPHVIGFCCYIWNITRVRELLPLVKERLPDVVIVLGGPEVGYCAKDVLTNNPLVDYVLTGEGERSLPLLCDALLHRRPVDVAGVTYRVEGGIVSLPEEPLSDEPPSPYCEEYFEALNGRIAYLETSRGCPYSCAYCLSARCGKPRFFNIERAKRELLLLAGSGTKTVKLVDRTFNANRQRAKDLWRFIIENYPANIPQGVCFHFEIAGDLLDEESLEIIGSAPAGLMQFEIGIQSFHAPTLNYIRRKTDLAKLTENIRRLLGYQNAHIHIDLIAGLPFEDFATFAHSFNQAFALQPNMLQLGFLKLIHGSPMREEEERYPCTFDATPPYQVTGTPWLNTEELSTLSNVEDALERLYNSGRFVRSLPLAMTAFGGTSFEFFSAFGERVVLPQGCSLNRVAKEFYDFALDLGVEANVLRTAMVLERLERVRGGKLPDFLQVQDERLSAFRKQLRKDPATAPKAGVPRGTALLYQPLRGVYVDYTTPHPITGAYPLQITLLEEQDEL